MVKARGEITISNVEDGEDGRGITKITEYYLATSASSGITHASPGWSTDASTQKLTSEKKYLWSYTETKYSDGSISRTEPKITGVYGDKGDEGMYIPTPHFYDDYPEDYVFRAGATKADGHYRKDVVMMKETGSGGAMTVRYYECTADNAKSKGKRPGTDIAHWSVQPMNKFTSIATELLLAESGYIKFLSSNGIRIYDVSGANTGYIGGSAGDGNGKVMWLGDSAAEAYFQLDEHGNAQYGRENENHIVISASDRRIRIYKANCETPVSEFHGENITGAGIGTLSETVSVHQASCQSAEQEKNTVLSQFTITGTGVVTIKGTLTTHYDDTGAMVPEPYCLAAVTLERKTDDGKWIAMASQVLPGRTSEDEVAPVYKNAALTLSGSVTEGEYRVTATLRAYGADGMYAQATMSTPTATFGYYRAEYGANGLWIGTASDNYVKAINDGGDMLFEVRAGNYGLHVGSDGIKKLSAGNWVSF